MNDIAACVDDVPFMFLYSTWLTLSPELCTNKINLFNRRNKRFESLDDNCYLVRAAVVRAVFLVDDDGVPHVSHYEISEHQVPGVASVGPRPRLHPDAVLCLGEHRVYDCHVLDTFFVRVVP